MMSEKKSGITLRELQELEFAALELNLYLDTHPEDEKAIKKLAGYNDEINKMVAEYEEKETMLYSQHIKSKADLDKWINDPWPWEKK